MDGQLSAIPHVFCGEIHRVFLTMCFDFEEKRRGIMRTIVVLCGSDSDLGRITSGLAVLRVAEAQGLVKVLAVEVCSTHRNPKELRDLLYKFSDYEVDVVIVCAGKLAAIFGDADAISRNEYRNNHTCFIVVPIMGKSEEANQAAYLSAKEVPNAQFVFREEFFAESTAAFEYAVNGELPEILLSEQKPPQTFNLAGAYHHGRRKYPENASVEPMIQQLESGGLIHVSTGKTREMFVNPRYPNLLYILATNRVSIFDIVLNTTIPQKGAVLTAMTIHWLVNVFRDVPNHLLAYGNDIVAYLPPELCSELGTTGLCLLMKNMIVVRRTKVLKIEAIVRGYLTGSGLADYQKSGSVCGVSLPPGLIDGSELPAILFTPSTKADYGQHDENISFERAVEIVGREAAEYVRDMAVSVYRRAKERLAFPGITLADTKFEFGYADSGEIVLIDEVLTPDSSRFWPEEERKVAMAEGRTSPSFDKEVIRIAGRAANVKSNPNWIPPQELVLQTTRNYRCMVELATGKPLERFQEEDMGIPK